MHVIGNWNDLVKWGNLCKKHGNVDVKFNYNLVFVCGACLDEEKEMSKFENNSRCVDCGHTAWIRVIDYNEDCCLYCIERYRLYRNRSGVILNATVPETEETITHESGAKSSYCPDFSQIPLDALIVLAKRYELGEQKYGRDQWRSGLHDKRYVIERLNHIIRHAFTAIQKLEGKLPDDGDDDAGAILWGGCFLVEALKVHKNG